MEKPKSKKQAFKEYKTKKGYHHMADPLHPMNSERVSKLVPIKTPNKSLARRKSGGKVGNRLY